MNKMLSKKIMLAILAGNMLCMSSTGATEYGKNINEINAPIVLNSGDVLNLYGTGTLNYSITGEGTLNIGVSGKDPAFITTNASNVGVLGNTNVLENNTLKFDGGFMSCNFLDNKGIVIFLNNSEGWSAGCFAFGSGSYINNGTLDFYDGGYPDEILNNGLIRVGLFLDTKVVGGTLRIQFSTSPENPNCRSASCLAAEKNIIEDGITLYLQEGTLGGKVVPDTEGSASGTRKLQIVQSGIVTAKADYIAIDTEVNGELDLQDGTFASKLTGSGTAKIIGNVNIDNPVTMGCNVVFASGSTLKVDGTKITSTAAISGYTSAKVESGSKLYVANAVAGTPYKILSGTNTEVNSWLTDSDMGSGFKSTYGLKVDVDNIVSDGNGFTIQFIDDGGVATSGADITNVVSNCDGQLRGFIDNVSDTMMGDVDKVNNAINTMVNANILASTQHAAVSVVNNISQNIYNNVDAVNRPKLNRDKDETRICKVSADANEEYETKVIELGQPENLMPVKEEKQEYDKQIWASIVHSKEKIEGMKTGSLEQDSTLQYNGTTVGADLWSNDKGFGGVALTYADGNVASNQMSGNVQNDADYYGASVYHRQDIGNVDVVTDISYTHIDNDITTNIANTQIKARPKVDVYSVGTKIEAELPLSRASKLAPYLGARYSKLQNQDFTNSLGGRFDVDNANLFTVPVGLALRSHLKTSEGWDFGSVLEGGYEWNLGDRDSTQRFSYGGAYDIIGFDIVDSGQYYIKAALTAAYQNLLFELLYRYSKGKTVRDNNWRLNVNWGF